MRYNLWALGKLANYFLAKAQGPIDGSMQAMETSNNSRNYDASNSFSKQNSKTFYDSDSVIESGAAGI